MGGRGQPSSIAPTSPYSPSYGRLARNIVNDEAQINEVLRAVSALSA